MGSSLGHSSMADSLSSMAGSSSKLEQHRLGLSILDSMGRSWGRSSPAGMGMSSMVRSGSQLSH